MIVCLGTYIMYLCKNVQALMVLSFQWVEGQNSVSDT